MVIYIRKDEKSRNVIASQLLNCIRPKSFPILSLNGCKYYFTTTGHYFAPFCILVAVNLKFICYASILFYIFTYVFDLWEKHRKRTILNINKKEREHKYLVEKEDMFSLKETCWQP